MATIEELYNEIGQSLVMIVQGRQWNKVIATAEVTDDTTTITVRIYDEHNDKGESVRPRFELARLFETLRNTMNEQGEGLWSVARYSVTDEGAFHVEFTY